MREYLKRTLLMEPQNPEDIQKNVPKALTAIPK